MTDGLAAREERDFGESLDSAGNHRTPAGAARWWPLIMVIVIGAAVRLIGIDWGLPYVYDFDEPNNLIRTLTMLREGDPNPHWFHYGSLMFYIFGGVIAAGAMIRSIFSGGSWVAQLESPEMIAAASGHMSDPWSLLAARYTSLAVSILTIVVIYVVVRRLTRRHWAAGYAALLFALAPIAVTEGRLFAPNTLSALFAAVAIAASIRVYERGRVRDYVRAGAVVGLAAGAKYNAGLVGIAVLIAHAMRAREAAPLYQRGPLISIYAALGSFLLTTPFALIDAREFFGDLGFELFHYSTGHLGSQDSGVFLVAFVLAFSTSLVLVPFALIDRGHRRPATITVGYASVYLIIFSLFATSFARNLLPILPGVCVVVGLGASAAWDRFVGGSRQIWRIGLIALMISSTAVAASAVVSDYSKLEDRSDAVEWIASNLPSGSIVVVDVYSPWLDPADHSIISPGFITNAPLPDEWDYMILTDRGSGRFEGLGSQGQSLIEISSTTCLQRELPGVEIRVPDCP